jgi:hypothetical protein
MHRFPFKGAIICRLMTACPRVALLQKDGAAEADDRILAGELSDVLLNLSSRDFIRKSDSAAVTNWLHW